MSQAKRRPLAEQAPVTETPESPRVVREVPRAAEPVLETPETPVVSAVERPSPFREGVNQSTIIVGDPVTVTTYTMYNPTNSPVVSNAIDTGVGSALYDRPSTFTPAAGVTAAVTVQSPSVATTDWVSGVGSTAAARPSTFESPTVTIQIDPGLAVNS